MTWHEDNLQRLASLNGRTIVKAVVVEMAMIESGPNGRPLFRVPGVPFVQALAVEFELDTGIVVALSNYQNNDVFGIYVRVLDELSGFSWPDTSEGEPSIFRAIDNFQDLIGRVTDIRADLREQGDLASVGIEVDGKRLLLKAGEVIEGRDRSFTVREQDESVLIFSNEEDASGFRFYPYTHKW